MGVVKEVVAALERSPVSARDLNDLKVGRIQLKEERCYRVGMI